MPAYKLWFNQYIDGTNFEAVIKIPGLIGNLDV